MELRAETAPTNTLRAPERRKRNEPHLTTREHRQEDLTAPHLSKRKQKRGAQGVRPWIRCLRFPLSDSQSSGTQRRVKGGRELGERASALAGHGGPTLARLP